MFNMWVHHTGMKLLRSGHPRLALALWVLVSPSMATAIIWFTISFLALRFGGVL